MATLLKLRPTRTDHFGRSLWWLLSPWVLLSWLFCIGRLFSLIKQASTENVMVSQPSRVNRTSSNRAGNSDAMAYNRSFVHPLSHARFLSFIDNIVCNNVSFSYIPNMKWENSYHCCVYISESHVYIPVGCVTPACWPYPVVSGGGGGLYA